MKLDKYHKHEALDRSYMLLEMWGTFLEEHPAVEAYPDLKEQADNIGKLMGVFYQKCGEKFL